MFRRAHVCKAATAALLTAALAAVAYLDGANRTVTPSSLGSTARALLNEDFNKVPSLGNVGAWDVVALVFMGTCLALASAGGVGGGPMLVPILVRGATNKMSGYG